MRFDILTLFPELVKTILGESITGRAQTAGAIAVYAHNIRDYSQDKHRRVDDTPYGGGRGMLMSAPPIYSCFQAVSGMQEADFAGKEFRRRVIYMSPAGRLLTQGEVSALASYDALTILCGHYEGVDRRIIDEIADDEISIGDYVLTGGEMPACILTDAVARLCPGVLSDSECHEKESFTSGLLEYPQYTRPFNFHGVEVPCVLIGGNHAEIDKWRLEKSLELTRIRRPELYSSYLEAHPAGNGRKKKTRKEACDEE